MSKHGKGGPKPKQPQPSFFQVQKQKLGADFMNRMNTEFVRKNALKVFKDIATGSIKAETDYVYFNNFDFTWNLQAAAQDNATYNYMTYIGLSQQLKITPNPDMHRVCNMHYENYQVFSSIAVHLNNILQNITLYNGVYTKQYLLQMQADIRWKKNAFSGYFITLPRNDDRLVRGQRRDFNDQRSSNQSEGSFFDRANKGNV